MKADYGAQIQSPGMIVVPSNDAYNFGTAWDETGDFTIECLFQTTQPGTLMSRISTEDGETGWPSDPGWILAVKPYGTITFIYDYGHAHGFDVKDYGHPNIYSVKDFSYTSALDGTWHHVAVVRAFAILGIYFDGQCLACTNIVDAQPIPQAPRPGPGRRLLFGNSDHQQWPYRQFTGIIEDAALWNRALCGPNVPAGDKLIPSMFNLIQGNEPGLVGYWDMDNDFDDGSPIHNSGQAQGSVAFVPVFHCIWAEAANDYAYLAIDNHYVSQAAYARATTSRPATRTQTIAVQSGTPFIYGAIFDKTQDAVEFPVGAKVTVQQPDGTLLNQESNTNELYLHMHSDSVWQIIVKDPQPGDWIITVTSPQNVPFFFSLQSVPSVNVVGTIVEALTPVYPHVARTFVASSAQRQRLAASMTLWGTLGEIAGLTIAAVALGAAAAGSIALLPATLAAVAGLLVGQAVLVVDQMINMPTVTAGAKLASQVIGFEPDPVAEVGLNLQGGYIKVENNAAYDFGTGDFTCEAWIKPTKPGPVFGRKSSAGAGFLFMINPHGVVTLVSDGGSQHYALNSPATPAFDGKWHHIAAVRKSGNMQCYYDGQPLGGSIDSSRNSPRNVSNNLPLLIGSVSQHQQKHRFLQGLLSEVRIWNLARSREQIKGAMDMCVPHDAAGIVGYWPFVNDSSVDLSPTGNNGLVQGALSFKSEPGQALAEVQLGRNAARGYEYVGEHTFLAIMVERSVANYPSNVDMFFDCSGGHGDNAGHEVPVNLGSIVVRGRPNDLIRMATGSTTIDPSKKVYGSGSEWGQGTAGINVTGTINRNGFCHQVANRLLYAAVWPNREVTLGQASPFVRGYWITVLWTGVYGKSWASKYHDKEKSFAQWCSDNGFPPPPSEDTSMHNDVRALEPDHRRAFMTQAIELQEAHKPGMEGGELDELEKRAKANLAQALPGDLIEAMDLG